MATVRGNTHNRSMYSSQYTESDDKPFLSQLNFAFSCISLTRDNEIITYDHLVHVQVRIDPCMVIIYSNDRNYFVGDVGDDNYIKYRATLLYLPL